ncbi:MAG: glycosyltransferase [Gemmatimonadota bacterium]
MQRILLVAYHFPPSDAIGARRAGRFARLLPQFGYEVDVLCSELPLRGEEPHDDPKGVGFADPTQTPDLPPGTVVHRSRTPFLWGRYPDSAPPAGSRTRTASWYAKTYADWYLATRDWDWRWGHAALEAQLRRGGLKAYDAIVVDAPPNGYVAEFILAAYEAGVPSILDLRDLWLPKKSVKLPGLLHPALRRRRWDRDQCIHAVARSSHVVLTSEVAADEMRSAFSVLSPDHFSVVYNAFEADDVEPDDAPAAPFDGTLRITYTGSLAYGRDKMVVRLIEAMAANQKQGGPPVRLTLVGSEQGDLPSLAARLGVADQIDFHGWATRDEAVAIQQASHVLLLLQTNEPFGAKVAIPGKLFEYMARRRPILSMATKASNQIVADYELGEVVDADDVESIAASLPRLAKLAATGQLLPRPPEDFSDVSTTRELAARLDAILDPSAATSPA